MCPLPPERSARPLITLASDVSVLRLEGTGDDGAEYVTEGGEPEGGDDDEAPVTADEIVERLASEIAARVLAPLSGETRQCPGWRWWREWRW